MELFFENKYLVSEEGGGSYHTSMREGTLCSPDRQPIKGSGVMRIAGLAAAILIIVISVSLRENIILFIGLALAAVYIYRMIYFMRKNRRVSNISDASYQAGRMNLKWERVIRFGEEIIVDDPRYPSVHFYKNLVRISEDPIYYTLWFSDHFTLRIFKNGFTIGTCDAFEAYIEQIINRNLLTQAQTDKLK